MCFGGDENPPAPIIGPPPPPPEMMDIIDEITGTQSVIVTGADGKKRRVNSRLPRTPEEEQKLKMAEDLIASSMKNIQQLYKYNPESAVNYAPLIDTFANLDRQTMQSLGQIANMGNIEQDIAQFKQMQASLIDEQFENRERENQERMAHQGVGMSTHAAESRAALTRAHALARQEGDAKASMYGEDLASKRLARNAQAFGLEEMGRNAQRQTAQNQFALAKEHEADMERRRARAIEEQRGLLGIGSAIAGQDLDKALGNTNAATSLNTFNAQATDSMNRYNADVNRQMANFKMANENYDKTGPSMGEMALKLGATAVGTYFGGPMGGAAAGSAVGAMTSSGKRG